MKYAQFLASLKMILTPNSGSWAILSPLSYSAPLALSGSALEPPSSLFTTRTGRMPIPQCKAVPVSSQLALMSALVCHQQQHYVWCMLLTFATAYFQIAMGILCFVFLICSIRTNLLFFLIFFTLVPAFGLLAGNYFHLARGNADLAKSLREAAGAFCFVACLCGWYIFFAIMLASVDFPFDLPRKLPTGRTALLLVANPIQSSTCRASSRVQARNARSNTWNKYVATIEPSQPGWMCLKGRGWCWCAMAKGLVME